MSEIGYYDNSLTDKVQDLSSDRSTRNGHKESQTTEPHDEPPQLNVVMAGEIFEKPAPLRKPLIEGLLRRSEVMNLIAAPKTGKSWLSLSLALSVAAGREWLGRFECRPGRVLLVDNELHAETLQDRLRRVTAAMDLRPDDIGDRLGLINVRGRLMNDARIAAELRRLPHKWDMVILDALYRFIPEGVSENDNAAITQLYNRLDALAESLNAGVVLVHHTSKGSQASKGVTDVGSGAGSINRAADSILVLREHQQEHHVVVDARFRSFEPLEPFSLRWEHPCFHPSDEQPATKRPESPHESRQAAKDREAMDLIIRQFERERTPLTKHALRGLTGYGADRLTRLLHKLEATKEVVEAGTEDLPNGKTTTLYKLGFEGGGHLGSGF